MALWHTVLVLLAVGASYTLIKVDTHFFRWGLPEYEKLNELHTAPTIPVLLRSDGRSLAYETYGPAYGYPVFYMNDIGMSRRGPEIFALPNYLDSVLKKYNVRLIGMDRAGAGLSAPHPGRSLADTVDDIRAVADFLDLETFGVLGIGAGAPYAIACAQILPNRVVTVGAVNGHLGGDAHLNWLQRLARYVPAAARILVRRSVFRLYSALPMDAFRFLPFSKPDAQLLRSKEKKMRAKALLYLKDIVEGFREGGESGAEDLSAGDELTLGAMDTPVHLFVGDGDEWTSVAGTEWAAGVLGNASVTVVEGQGRFGVLAEHADAVVNALGKEFFDRALTYRIANYVIEDKIVRARSDDLRSHWAAAKTKGKAKKGKGAR